MTEIEVETIARARAAAAVARDYYTYVAAAADARAATCDACIAAEDAFDAFAAAAAAYTKGIAFAAVADAAISVMEIAAAHKTFDSGAAAVEDAYEIFDAAANAALSAEVAKETWRDKGAVCKAVGTVVDLCYRVDAITRTYEVAAIADAAHDRAHAAYRAAWGTIGG